MRIYLQIFAILWANAIIQKVAEPIKYYIYGNRNQKT